jgi:hypothetical protein
MQIKIRKFKEIVGERALHQAGVHAIPNAHRRAVQFYCDKLTVRGACTGECDLCALKIKDAVEWMIQKKPASPYGLYTWLLKNASAKRVEELAQRPRLGPETNAFGEATGRDPLDILMEALS